jgi:hypothetical protein
MAESVAPTESASVYQLRVVVAGVSPLIGPREKRRPAPPVTPPSLVIGVRLA